MSGVLLRSGSFLFIILLGWLLKSCGMFGKEDYRILSKVVLNISLPAAIIISFSTIHWSAALLLLPVAGVLFNLIQIWGGWLLTAKKPVKDRLLYMFNSGGSNIGAFALPFVQSYFGPEAVVGVCLFDVGNGMMCTGVNYGVVRAMVPAEGEKMTPALLLKRIFGTGAFPCYILMVAVTLLGIPVPEALLDFISPIAKANPFVAMLMVGMMFEFHPRREYLEPMFKIMGLRLTIAAGLAALAWFVLPLPLEMRQALAVVAFAPISVVSPAFTAQCGGNAQLAGCINSFSILIGVGMMMLMVVLLGLA